jgi:hypothetical protein
MIFSDYSLLGWNSVVSWCKNQTFWKNNPEHTARGKTFLTHTASSAYESICQDRIITIPWTNTITKMILCKSQNNSFHIIILLLCLVPQTNMCLSDIISAPRHFFFNLPNDKIWTPKVTALCIPLPHTLRCLLQVFLHAPYFVYRNDTLTLGN